jgi:hypothetical protein
VIPEKSHPSRFDDWQVVIATVINHIDRNSGDMLGKGTCGRKGSTEVGEYLARLNGEITSADKLPLYVFRLLASDKYQLGTLRDNDLSVCVRLGQIRRVDAFYRHLF